MGPAIASRRRPVLGQGDGAGFCAFSSLLTPSFCAVFTPSSDLLAQEARREDGERGRVRADGRRPAGRRGAGAGRGRDAGGGDWWGWPPCGVAIFQKRFWDYPPWEVAIFQKRFWLLPALAKQESVRT